ncbi:hypothetical protein TMatcc_000810 [Talaromyces marneffei ATCC 18224]|uniref:DNA repair protein rad60 n=1 Tax=Talaromyces marneffei PM1 TaxID=1077442 RepID=A0A093XIY1_TALMA|nr:uncharacterized protein EYB26_003359 [Talaromyces marneffei]KAE8549774.1 hypothetical protein EYB25_008298 [Talaromyces marneffei]QGA15699.1 hypothetical protein EYB26_003359 [Talaromyces marneffei]
MRSFFNKPAWAKTDDEPSAPEFYRRSHQTYKDILKANREQRREDVAKSALTPAVESTKVPVRSSKRRRISDPEVDPTDDAREKNGNGSTASSPPVEQSDESNSIEYVESRRHSDDIDDGVALERELSAADTYGAPSPEVQVVDEPPRFEKSLSRRLPTLSPERDSNTSSSHSVLPTNAEEAKAALDTRENTEQREDKKAEVVVEILVTSEIENTKPLIVRRHMSQRFRDIRLTWCARQGFDQKMTDSVYLTWNRRRLFDVTTCKSLDVGSLSSPSDLDFDDEPRTLRIHVEAVTDEFLKARAEAERSTMAPPTPSQTAESEAFHIVLKSPSHGDLKVKVLPRTPVLQIMANFKSKRNISSDLKILLSFDGDILDPDSQLKDYDIDDMDLVEVILR